MVSANETQVGGQHYKDTSGKCPHCGGLLEHWDIAWAFRFNCFQYIITKWIWRQKGTLRDRLQDLDKVIHATSKYQEVIQIEEEGHIPLKTTPLKGFYAMEDGRSVELDESGRPTGSYVNQ